MDIASVEFLSSRSIEAFIDHPHVLDGSIGRTLAYLAVSLLLGLRLWLGIPQGRHIRLLPYQITILIAGFAGAFLVIHGALSEAVDPFAAAFSMQEVPVFFSDYRHMLLRTMYGNAWIAYGVSLAAGVLLARRPWPGWICAVGAGAALAVCGHSGEYGLRQPLYWAGAIHLLLALSWFGGLAVLVVARLGGGWQADLPALRFFSRVALPLFILIVLTGGMRLGLQYYYEQGLGAIYLIMLGFKLAAIAGVVWSAARLRGLLRAPAFGEDESGRYDNGLGTEMFFAALLIFATSLLTQLPPK